MNIRIVTVKSILLIICCLAHLSANAQNFDMNSREWSTKKTGSTLKSCFQAPSVPPTAPCDTLLCQVDFFNNPGVLGSNFGIKEIRSFVKFYINHNDANIYAPFTYRLSYQIRGFKTLNSSTPTDVFQDTLMINYNPDSINAYQDVHMRSYYGYFKIEVKVLEMYDCTAGYAAALTGSSSIPAPTPLSTSSSLATMSTNWNIEAGMVLQKFDLSLSTVPPSTVYSSTMSGIVLAPSHTLVPNTNTLRINWDLSTTQKPDPALYELEWTYADNYLVSLTNGQLSVNDKTTVPYDFRDNSTRIITNKTSYDIPLVYKRGYIAYRVRLLRPDNANYQQTKYGPWSNSSDHGTVSISNGFYKIAAGHLNDQSNWNFEASYAEEGKSKQVLGYFDGLLKSRQTLTRFGSRPNELIGAEQFYDYEGRVGLQTLPIPVLQNTYFSYIQNFARSATSQQPYKAADFDPLVTPGSGILLPGLDATSAARAYYSPQNSLLGAGGYGMMKSVPDAEGFPVLHTRYSPDDPGRIRVQGSAGKELQIGKGHETSYFYADPDQEELNQYFGVNIGKAKFYEKVITRDPNKELSFSVLNNGGQPVMTGLMGFPDPANNTTLLNLDGVTAPSGPYPATNLFYGNPPSWSGSRRIFNKTLFKETSGGSLTYALTLPPFLPCTGHGLVINIPLQYNIACQGENDAAPVSLIGNTIVAPAGGSATGPTVSTTVGTTQASPASVSLTAVGPGENTISYTATYNPDHVDTAIRQYLRDPALYPGCYLNESIFLQNEIANLPDYCDDVDNDHGATECGQYESIMKKQLMPMGTYGAYLRLGNKGDIVVGNGRSLFAIVDWQPRSNAPFAPAPCAVPNASQASVFEPWCFPALSYPSGLLNDKLDYCLQFYKPVYAYQKFRPSFSATTTYNNASITVDTATDVNYLLEVFNDDIANALLPLHPEYCTYKQRYCDGSNYVQLLQAIPSAQVAQNLQRFSLAQLISADPFRSVYITQAGHSSDDLKYMTYNTLDASSGAVNGNREIAIDYFAYLKATCDASGGASTCWAAGLPNSGSGQIDGPTNLNTLINSLSNEEKDLYFQQLLSLYIANRGYKIAQYRDPGYTCGSALKFPDLSHLVFQSYFDSNGNLIDPPATYTTGNLMDNIQTNTNNMGTPGQALNDLEAYAVNIVKQLLNCRQVTNPNYSSYLFTGLLADLKAKMAENVFSRDRIWKGGITPIVLRQLMVARGINLDDLCNPYLVNYALSPRAATEYCKIDSCGPMTPLLPAANSSFLRDALLDIYALYVPANSNQTAVFGTGTLNAPFSNQFEKTILLSLGLNPATTASLNYSWTMHAGNGPNNDSLALSFTNGTAEVKIVWRPQSHLSITEDADENLNKNYWAWNQNDYNPVNNYYRNYLKSCTCDSGGFAITGCIPNTDNEFGAYYIKRDRIVGLAPQLNSAFVMYGSMKFYGLDLSPTPDSSLPCIHTCIACNELKDAYKVYQTEVADKYGIKGKGHPFYETTIRSFFNYYFRNRHYTDEYLDFMKGCSLSDSLFLPQYYGYFQAAGTTAQIDLLVSSIHNFTYVSPTVPPLASPGPAMADTLRGIKCFRYVDATGRDRLYVDFNSIFKDERLRPFIEHINGVFANYAVSGFFNNSYCTFNMLNSQEFGQPAYSTEIFLPGHNTALPGTFSLSGLTVSNENVTVKDADPTNPTVLLTQPFTHYRFQVSPTSSTHVIAATFGQLADDLSAMLHAAPAINSYVEFSSHESYRATHNNNQSNKIAYLNYAYSLPVGSTHDAILQQLQAPTVQSNVYTSGSTILKDVSYKSGLSTDGAFPSSTLLLRTHSSSPATTTNFTLLGNMLENSKGIYSGIGFFWFATNHVSASSPLVYAFPGQSPNPSNAAINFTVGSDPYRLASVRHIANNTYAFLLVPASTPSIRNYNVYLRLPEYISQEQALKYDLVSTSIAPVVFGDSKRYFKAVFQMPGNPANSFEAVGKADFDLVTTAPDAYQHVMLCDNGDENAADSITICYDQLLQYAYENAAVKNSKYQDSLYNSLRFVYRQFIADSLKDTMLLSQPQMKYAVTLYNYDRAGNLMSTVPPMGVQPMSSTAGVDAYRDAASPTGTPPQPAHSKKTEYNYGSLNQKLSATTPDGGLTSFLYDAAGRVILSQNSKQYPDNYSYTLYDDQNRPIETGKVTVLQQQVLFSPKNSLAAYVKGIKDQSYSKLTAGHAYFRGLIAGTVREEVIRTTYDTAMYVFATTNGVGVVNNGMSRQDNLRGRVTAVASYKKLAAGFTGYTGYDIALHYSYDLSGNLKTLTYDMPNITAYRQRYKRIDYDYDLYSGKVTLVSYNRGFGDQFYQHYCYDDDNRITTTETSRDGLLWDRDAAYQYYPHGPLARISLGDRRVQGIDFAYTLQGWLKTINGDSPAQPGDIGGDGTGNNAHQADLFRTTLAYFDGDFKPIDPTDATNVTGSKLLKLPAPPAVNRSLYNGNIAAATTLPGYFAPLYTSYRYDKLNRIKSADYQVPDYNSSTPLATGGNPYAISGMLDRLYHSDYTYDLDGNLSTLNRYGFKSGSGAWGLTSGQVYLMDSLHYYYFHGNQVNNKLTNFTDDADHSLLSGGFSNDLAKYNPANADSLLRLQYDATGNLVQDMSNGLTSIDWTLYGKTREIVKDDGHNVRFAYDPLGNRFSKTTITTTAGIDSILNTEFYIREASGNVLATYRQQQHYHYYNPYDRIVVIPNISNAVGILLGRNGGFSGEIVRGSVLNMPAAFSTARIGTQSATFYTQNSSIARAAMLDSTASLATKIARYSSRFAGWVYPAGPEASWEPFLPLAEGIADTAGLTRSAALVFTGSDSTEMRTRYAATRGLDPGASASPEFLAGRLTQEILDWRSLGAGAALDNLKKVILPDNDSAGTHYTAVVQSLLRDSLYMKAPLVADTEAGMVTLDSRLRPVINQVSIGGDQAYPGERQVTGDGSQVAADIVSFLELRYSGAGSDSTIAYLRRQVGDEPLLSAAYAANPTAYLTALLTDEGTTGGNTAVAKAVYSDALRVASGGTRASGQAGSLGDAGSPMGLLGSLAMADPSKGDALSSVLTLALDYDRFYLAEHTMYGSSRVGIKKYWPYQYRYEWNKAKSISQNQAVLDSSELAYRLPWYYGPWQSLVSSGETDPVGHANNTAQYTSRIVGQKGYELTNHLGNVMAVVSDKVTEQRQNSSAPLPTAAVKRAGLSAAYDYYPFGMQMPGRTVEDATVQCVPVSRYRKVDKIVSSEDLLQTYNPSDGTSPKWTNSGGYTSVTYNAQSAGYTALMKSLYGTTTLDAYMTFRALPSATTGLIVDVNIVEQNYPTMNRNYAHLIGQGTLGVELRNLASGGIGTYLTTAYVTGGGTARLTVPPGMVAPGNVIRLWMHYDAPPPPTLPFFYNNYTKEAQIVYTSVVSNVIKPVDEQYVTLSCDTDGNYAAGYRYGFNGKQKDNEIAGQGNYIDFGERGYDPRRVGWWTPDKLAAKYPGMSSYVFCRDNPILRYDPDGNTDFTATIKTSKASNGTLIKTATADIVYDIINISNKDIFNSSQLAGAGYNNETFSGSFTEKVNGKDVTTNVTTNVSYKLVNSIDQVKSGENVAFIVDDIEPQTLGHINEGLDPVGLADLGGSTMAIEYDWMGSDVVVKHEQTHGLGGEHSGSGYMRANGATKSGQAGKMSPGMFKDLFRGLAYRSDGQHNITHGDSKKAGKEFLQKTHMQYNHEKAKKANLE